MVAGLRKAVLLDRDGVIVRPNFRDGRSFAPLSLAEFEIEPQAAEVLGRFKAADYLLIVVTNQPDVGAGKLGEAVLEEMHARLRTALPLDAIYVCPHTGAENCACRKPKPGMLRQAAEDWALDLSRSFMIGDRWSDVEAAHAAGCAAVFIDYDYNEPAPREPVAKVASLSEAGHVILWGKQ